MRSFSQGARWRHIMILGAWVGASTAQAQSASDLVSGAASLKNISFSVVSLAPGSGQDAWVQFGTRNGDGGMDPEYGSVSFSGQTYRDAEGYPVSPAGQSELFEGPLPQSPLSLTAVDGSASASASAGNMSASMRLPATALAQAPAWPGSDRQSVEVWSASRFGESLRYPGFEYDDATGSYRLLPGFAPTQPVNFILSPHSQLVLEADASALVSVSTDIHWDSGSGGEFNPTVGAGAMLSLARGTPLHPLADTYDSWWALEADVMQAYDLQQDILMAQFMEDPAAMTPADRHLRVTLRNDGDEALSGVAVLTTMASAQLVQAVPEPGTYLLMGLGLVGVFWQARRRRA